MVEMLPAYGFINNQDDYHSVEERLNDIQNRIGHFKTDGGFDELKQELVDIKKEVLRREEQFYIDLGLTGGYKQLNDKISAIEKKYDVLLPNGKIIQYIKQHFSFVGIAHASDEELQEATEDVLNDFLENEAQSELFRNSLGALSGNQKLNEKEALDKYIQQNLVLDTNGKSKRFITSRGDVKVGLGKIVTSYDPKKNKVKVQIDDTFKISSTFRNKLEKDLTKIYSKYNSNEDKIKPTSKEDYKDKVNQILEQEIDGFSLLHINTNQFDLNRSLSSTIGYLGEIRAVAMLKELAPNGDTKGTGALRDSIKKQEIPIDVVCMANGFQIKNYALDDNAVTLSGGQKVPYWTKNRLRLEGEIADIIIELFGIYQYNQPIQRTKTIKTDPADLAQYKELYSNIMGSNGLVYQLTDVFNSRIPQMIKISEEFSVDGDPMFGERDVYFNTFFWINKYLVPASWILEKLIEALDEKNTKKLISANYTFSDPLKNKDRWQVQRLRQKYGIYSPMPEKMANFIKANYDITIDLTDFVNF